VTRAALALLGPLAALAIAGCRSCSAAPAPPDAAPPFEPPRAIVPAPTAWAFARTREPGAIALPSGCRLARPALAGDVGPRTRFAADPLAIGSLVVGEADESGEKLVRAGIVSFGRELEPKGALPIPWHAPAAIPRFARDAQGSWLLAVEQPADKLVELALWREGGASERIAIGAGLDAVDLACAPRCALLATRLGATERPGADVWLVGGGGPPVRVEIPAAEGSDAAPLALARGGADVVAAVREQNEIAFYAVTEAGARAKGRVPAGHGFLAAATFGETPVAVTHPDPLGDNGCGMPDGGKPGVLLEAAGGRTERALVLTSPERAALVVLPKLGLLFTLERTSCDGERRVLHAHTLEADGRVRAGTRIPVADADAFAVAREGSTVDLWMLRGRNAVLARMTCE